MNEIALYHLDPNASKPAEEEEHKEEHENNEDNE
jgi:hypothetical protein